MQQPHPQPQHAQQLAHSSQIPQVQQFVSTHSAHNLTATPQTQLPSLFPRTGPRTHPLMRQVPLTRAALAPAFELNLPTPPGLAVRPDVPIPQHPFIQTRFEIIPVPVAIRSWEWFTARLPVFTAPEVAYTPQLRTSLLHIQGYFLVSGQTPGDHNKQALDYLVKEFEKASYKQASLGVMERATDAYCQMVSHKVFTQLLPRLQALQDRITELEKKPHHLPADPPQTPGSEAESELVEVDAQGREVVQSPREA